MILRQERQIRLIFLILFLNKATEDAVRISLRSVSKARTVIQKQLYLKLIWFEFTVYRLMGILNGICCGKVVEVFRAYFFFEFEYITACNYIDYHKFWTVEFWTFRFRTLNFERSICYLFFILSLILTNKILE